MVGTNEPAAYSSAAGLGLFRSEDGGLHWTRITSDPRPSLRIGGGDLPIIRVDPSNPDVVYSTGLVTMKSVDGGVTWTSLRGAPGGDDYQNLWINPNHSDTLALVSDQGAVITVNGGKTWSSWFNQPTAQLYHVSVSPTFPYRVCGGQQESGSVCISSRGNDGSVTDRDWHPVGVIEYGYVAPGPTRSGRDLRRRSKRRLQVSLVDGTGPGRHAHSRAQQLHPRYPNRAAVVLARRPAQALLCSQPGLQNRGRRHALGSHQPRPHTRQAGNSRRV